MTGSKSWTTVGATSITPSDFSAQPRRSDEIDLSTGRPLLSDLYDSDPFPQDPERMRMQLDMEHERYPFEMIYAHGVAEEVHRHYWTGIRRDWQKVQYLMDRDTQQMQRNN